MQNLQSLLVQCQDTPPVSSVVNCEALLGYATDVVDFIVK